MALWAHIFLLINLEDSKLVGKNDNIITVKSNTKQEKQQPQNKNYKPK